jgi:hypothetical protein
MIHIKKAAFSPEKRLFSFKMPLSVRHLGLPLQSLDFENSSIKPSSQVMLGEPLNFFRICHKHCLKN